MPRRQRIPRPDGAKPGGDPPWASLAASDRRGITLEQVRRAMATVGPVEPFPALPYAAAPAAVLVLLFEEHGEARVVLTRRSNRLRSHTGEVAFPGGRLEPGEAPQVAALREATEEVGLDAGAVEILGQLAPLATVSSRAGITPFVGILPGRPDLEPNPAEVDIVFDVPLAEFLAPDVYRAELWDRMGAPERPVHFFELEEDTVWGATARILHELLELVTLSGRTVPPEG